MLYKNANYDSFVFLILCIVVPKFKFKFNLYSSHSNCVLSVFIIIIILFSTQKETKINMPEQFNSLYSFKDELTAQEEYFFTLVESCNMPEIEKYLETNSLNINMKKQGYTPLHLAVQKQCEPLVDLFLRQKGEYIHYITAGSTSYRLILGPS